MLVTLKVQVFTGTYIRGDLFSRMGRILVLFLYFRAFWNIFRQALGKVWLKISLRVHIHTRVVCSVAYSTEKSGKY